MKRNNRQAQEQAKNYAFLLLKFRPRSVKEITERFKKKKFSASLISDTLIFLKGKDFLNDKAFARAWVESRLKKSYGLKKLEHELRDKGIAQKIIAGELRKAQKDYNEQEVVARLAEEKFSKLKDIAPEKAKQRIWAYLLRRGFSPEMIYDALDRL